MTKNITRMYLDLGYPCALCKLTSGVICFQSNTVEFEEFFCQDCMTDYEQECKAIFNNEVKELVAK